ncbi:MAG: hypothetical protein EBU90_03040 [Proteobacteria bacterium]|nr:hypothetical protein [Pseudomonadota bacterium]NBP13301.1 hypothetical protein [bacterium]
MFARLYTKQLNEEIHSINEFSTWNQGLLTTTIGPNFFKASGMKPTQRHRQHIPKDPGFRKHAQTVPDMHKIDPKSLQMLDDLKVSNSGRKVLSQDELQKVCTQYGVSQLNPSAPKKLGNTGILLKFDPNVRGYVLEK